MDLARRIAFRFGCLFAALVILPFPIGSLPRTEWLAEQLNRPWDWAVGWFSRSVLGITPPVVSDSGSGDTRWVFVQLLLIALLAVTGTILWSIVDRKRVAYPAVGAAVRVMLRYWLAATLVTYGLIKVLDQQFPFPRWKLDVPLAETSPMGLLWRFMGYSQPYNVFVGGAETLAGVLLLWRRTTLVGAIVAIATMSNVVLLNFCYDVPVKLLSLELLLAAVALAAPGLRRLLAAALGQAVREVPPRPRLGGRWELARRAAKIAFLVGFASTQYTLLSGWSSPRSWDGPLSGRWQVDQLVRDGQVVPPLATDAERWYRLAIDDRSVAITTMTETVIRDRLSVDEVARTVRLAHDGEVDTLRYTMVDPDHLELTGDAGGRALDVTLVRRPAPLILTRGFHWIQDEPFNR